jgi:hypothetical protein
MPKGSQFDDLARDAAQRIEEARAAGEQLTFLPDEPAPGAAGRPPRGKGKVTSQLRDWCAAKGLRMPEDVLIEMAAMASTEDAFLTAMARTEQLLAWAEAGATGYKGAPVKPSMAQRLAAFQFVYTAQLRAAEALLPYGLGKVTPDVAPPTLVPVLVAAPRAQDPGRPGDQARDVTPRPGRIGPPPMPMQAQRNQGVSEASPVQSDAASRTEGPSR